MKTITRSRHWVAALVMAAGLLIGGRAFADSFTCVINLPFHPFSCDTPAFFPNPYSNTLNISINGPFTTYRLTDQGSWVVVAGGETGGGWHDETIPGLYNHLQGYKLECWADTYSSCKITNN